MSLNRFCRGSEMEAQVNLSGMKPCVSEIGNSEIVQAEPSALNLTALKSNGQESSEAPKEESQSLGSNFSTDLSGMEPCVQETVSNKIVKAETSALNLTALKSNGAESSETPKEESQSLGSNFSTNLSGMEPCVEETVSNTIVKAEPSALNLTSLKSNGQESSEGPKERSKSLGSNSSGNLSGMEPCVQETVSNTNVKAEPSALNLTAIKSSDQESSEAPKEESQSLGSNFSTNLSGMEPRVSDMENNVIVIAEPSEFKVLSLRLNCQNSREVIRGESQNQGLNLSKNTKHSPSSLQSNSFSSEYSLQSGDTLGKDCKKLSAHTYSSKVDRECIINTKHDERKEDGITKEFTIEQQDAPQGALLGTATTSVSSGDMKTSHCGKSLEKALEIVKKRKNGMTKVEGESCQKSKRKRKPSKPSKSLEYCNETERPVVGNRPPTEATTSCDTDQVMSPEADTSSLNNGQFSMFSTQHMHFMLNFKRYECLKCGLCFASKRAMNVHIRTHSEEKPYWCTDCDKGFTQSHLYKAHMRIHTGERPYVCKECGADFADNTTLQNHELLHSESKNFQCALCPKMFKQRAGLACHMMNAHLQNHYTDQKPFWCSECNKGFTQNHSYKAHLRIHSGERPYLCKECGAAFADNKTLQNHKALHSDQKTFKCTICPKMFRQRAGLACHMKTHTDEKPFGCEQCGQSFKTKSTLKNHQRIHSEEKPYQCPMCPQAFKQRAGLACHSKVHDKGNAY